MKWQYEDGKALLQNNGCILEPISLFYCLSNCLNNKELFL
jgi:hypothetical protein